MAKKEKQSNNDDDEKKGDDPYGSLPVAHGIISNRKEIDSNLSKIQDEIIPSMSQSRLETLQKHLPSHSTGSSIYHNDSTMRDVKDMTRVQKTAMKRRKLKSKHNKRHEDKMAHLELRQMEHAMAAADAELILNTEESGLLEPEHEMEKTHKVTQRDLKYKHLNEGNARQIFDLKLDQYGPYGMSYDRSGRSGILYGRRGHVALMNCQQLSLSCEMHLNETIRDATFLHNDSMFALAQKKHVYIYDDNGAEIHHMDDHHDPFALQFLPYHWLLASIGRTGYLQYTDTSMGKFVSSHRTRLGPCSVLKQNPQNAVLHLGHGNGVVSMYSPAQSDALVKIHAHYGGPVRDLAIDPTGKYMVTAGADSKIKIWDLRTYKTLNTFTCFYAPPTSIDISQRGILGIGHGVHNTFWKPSMYTTRVTQPYMKHDTTSSVETLRFRPFEDVCGIGHGDGFSSIVIPGSGEPNLDSFEYNTNPYADRKQRREAEVKSLLDKLSPDMIALDSNVIGTVESDLSARQAELKEQMEEANRKKNENKKQKNRMRGKNKIGKKIKRKQKNIIDANTEKWLQSQKENDNDIKKRKSDDIENEAKEEAPAALKRFF